MHVTPLYVMLYYVPVKWEAKQLNTKFTYTKHGPFVLIHVDILMWLSLAQRQRDICVYCTVC